MYWSKAAIENMDRVKRLVIINSVSGIKPANLIGTKSKDGKSNLAIFSSVVHLGSDPALLGMISRPADEVRRHTMENIHETGIYTINHVNTSIVKKAHWTSAAFEEEVSEFERCGLSEEYLNDFDAPFVQESRIKIGLKLVEKIPIQTNGTVLVVGQIEHLVVPDDAFDEKGYLNLESTDGVGISGLNSYYQLKKMEDHPYARVSEAPTFE